MAYVIGLDGTVSHQGIGTLGKRIADQEFELSGLVAARGKAGAVVPLDIEIGTAQQLGEIGHRFERRRQVGEMLARKTGEMHVLSAFFWLSATGGRFRSVIWD